MATIPTTYDALFDELRGTVPLQYLRALSWMESGQNPRNKTGNYWGLFQVGPENLSDYNKAHGTNVSRDQLLDPRTNTQVFLWELGRIIKSLTAGGAPPDWGDPSWVGLLTMSWNAGWSKKGGTRKVLDYLRSKGLPLTHASVYAKAKEAGAVSHLYNAKKYEWQRGTALLYQQLERAPAAPIAPAAATKLIELIKDKVKSRITEWLWLAILVGAIILTHKHK